MNRPMNLSGVSTKWEDLLESTDFPTIKDKWRKKVTAQILENQMEAFASGQQPHTLLNERLPQVPQSLNEAAPANNISAGNIGMWDPVLISLVRRAMPNLIAYDVCGVQPMNGPTGLIFAFKSRYTAQNGTEALFNEANSGFSGSNSGATIGTAQTGTDPVGTGFPPSAGGPSSANWNAANYNYGTGMTTAQAEALGDGTNGNDFNTMAFSIDKITVSAVSRALKAEYTIELAQDLKAIHGLDAESELANILSAEILTEINREIIRSIYGISTAGAQATATPGVFDLDVDSNGRWSVEKFKGLLFQLERDCNAIAKATRRGRGNIAIVSSDCASALAMAGVLDYAPALSTNLTVDDTGNTFAGVLNGRIRVYIDPYYLSSGNDELAVVGYKGVNPYDAGLFYCPYVPLEMVRAINPVNFHPIIGFKTRYATTGNPFYSQSNGAFNVSPFYRIISVRNLL